MSLTASFFGRDWDWRSAEYNGNILTGRPDAEDIIETFLEWRGSNDIAGGRRWRFENMPDHYLDQERIPSEGDYMPGPDCWSLPSVGDGVAGELG